MQTLFSRLNILKQESFNSEFIYTNLSISNNRIINFILIKN